MMRFTLEIRALAMLRRIARALEERNRIERARDEMAQAIRDHRPRPLKVAEVFTPTVEQRNELWREENPYE